MMTLLVVKSLCPSSLMERIFGYEPKDKGSIPFWGAFRRMV